MAERAREEEAVPEVEAGPAAHGCAGEDEVPGDAIEGEGPAYCNEPRP